jgi:nitric oxide reductase subunit B
MLALSLATFSMRNIVKPEFWKERWMMIGFWGLNAGLMGMILMTLFPVGVLQAVESFQNGFWSARSQEFYQQPLVNKLLWLRVIPDTVFIFFGAIPIVAASLWGLFNMRAEKPIVEGLVLDPSSKPAVSPVYRSREQ